MNTSQFSYRLRLSVVFIAALTGCDSCDKPDPIPPPQCSPACGSGLTCQNGTCVGSCVASQCASGVCASASTCAQCSTNAQCGGATPVCSANRCVACVAGPTDNCAAGNYCNAATNTCTRGCKSDATCSSNSCNPTTHDCNTCTNDNECASGKSCHNGTCEALCGGSTACTNDQNCCGSSCQDAFRDDGCHACNITCSATQFCGESACVTTGFTQICSLTKVRMVTDEDGNDLAAGINFSSLIADACAKEMTITSLPQTNATVLNQTTGQPLAAPGVLNVFVGGTFFNAGSRYIVETSGLSKVFDTTSEDGSLLIFRRRADSTNLLEIDPSTIGPGHDFFIIELVKEPTTKALSLVMYGLDAPGTYAAAYYATNVLVPMKHMFPGTYYLIEWTDENGNNDQDPADRFDIHFHD